MIQLLLLFKHTYLELTCFTAHRQDETNIQGKSN